MDRETLLAAARVCEETGDKFGPSFHQTGAYVCQQKILALAEQQPAETAMPVCEAHIRTWFTERDQLAGGLSADCIVCAHGSQSALLSAARELDALNEAITELNTAGDEFAIGELSIIRRRAAEILADKEKKQ